jgi:hypothetical protein
VVKFRSEIDDFPVHGREGVLAVPDAAERVTGTGSWHLPRPGRIISAAVAHRGR